MITSKAFFSLGKTLRMMVESVNKKVYLGCGVVMRLMRGVPVILGKSGRVDSKVGTNYVEMYSRTRVKGCWK